MIFPTVGNNEFRGGSRRGENVSYGRDRTSDRTVVYRPIRDDLRNFAKGR